MPMSCPNCESTDTQAVRMMVAAGTTRQSGQSLHFGISSQGALATGTSDHSAVAMTDLAKRFQQPRPPQRNVTLAIVGALLHLPGIIMIVDVFSEIAVLEPLTFLLRLGGGLLAISPGLGVLYLFQRGDAAHQAKVRAWRARVAYLKHAWLCHRCGHDWRPET